jgi:dihydropteroate synthase
MRAPRPLVMGIVNVTPDSFSDGGRHLHAADAVARGLQLVDEGADLLDLGAESTRPGAAPVPLELELTRLQPVLDGLRRAGCRAPISVDTSKAAVARAALAAGASWVNDVSALQDPEMASVCAASG